MEAVLSSQDASRKSDSADGVWTLKWRPKRSAIWALLLMGAVFSYWIHSFWADGLTDFDWLPWNLFYTAFFAWFVVSEALNLLNLESPMRIELISDSPPRLRILTRSLRQPIIDDGDILRFTGDEEQAFLYFIPRSRKQSIWFKPIIPWATTEVCLEISHRQFATDADWHRFLSLVRSYPKKLEADVLAGHQT
ncbi:MAG: hypothetical protein KDN19_05075 [Verrucomicrobiae bacterium]|nr:hypothetical protein [Verrucomicrobiae bacterium]